MSIEKITGRIATNLESLKKFTAIPGNGCTRLPFTKEARDAVEYLKEEMENSQKKEIMSYSRCDYRADGVGQYFFFRLYEIYKLVIIPQSLR